MESFKKPPVAALQPKHPATLRQEVKSLHEHYLGSTIVAFVFKRQYSDKSNDVRKSN